MWKLYRNEIVYNYQDHVMSSIKTGSRKIIIKPVRMKSIQSVKMILDPLPDISLGVVEAPAWRFEEIHRLQARRNGNHLEIFIFKVSFTIINEAYNMTWKLYTQSHSFANELQETNNQLKRTLLHILEQTLSCRSSVKRHWICLCTA